MAQPKTSSTLVALFQLFTKVSRNLQCHLRRIFKHFHHFHSILILDPIRTDNTYHIPICIWLMDTHPYNAPLAYVQPTSDMQIKVSRFVDHNGKIYLPYLHEWNPVSIRERKKAKISCFRQRKCERSNWNVFLKQIFVFYCSRRRICWASFKWWSSHSAICHPFMQSQKNKSHHTQCNVCHELLFNLFILWNWTVIFLCYQHLCQHQLQVDLVIHRIRLHRREHFRRIQLAILVDSQPIPVPVAQPIHQHRAIHHIQCPIHHTPATIASMEV